jgi:hypothetical protein
MKNTKKISKIKILEKSTLGKLLSISEIKRKKRIALKKL